MTEQIRNPKLRFRDNKGNDYSPWILYSIKDVAKMSSGKSKKNENKGRYIIMDMGTVTKNGTMLTHKITPHENDLLKKGDLVMVKDDIGGGHIIGKTIFIPESQKYVLGDHVYRLEPKNYDGLFLHYCINSPIVNRSLKRKVTGSAQLGLNRKSVEEELIKVPCLEEQEKIGGFFSKLDRQIELEEQKLAKLEEQKKGYMQKIFSQELRFKNENGNNYPDWEVKKIGEIMDVASVKRIHQSDWTNEGVKFIRARDIVSRYKGKIVEDPLFISKERYEEYSKLSGKVKIGDLLVTGVGTIGVPLLINNEKPIYFKDGNIIWLKNEDNIDKNFLFYSFISRKTQNFIKSVAGIGTVGTYTISNAKKTPILLPVSIEQVKIGNFFNELDKSIKKQNKKVDLLKERKKGFLQKMFI